MDDYAIAILWAVLARALVGSVETLLTTLLKVLLVVLFSTLVGFIEIVAQSKARMRACLTGLLLVYLTILTLGNTVTMLAVSTLGFGSDGGVLELNPTWFWHPFLGVFGFRVLLQQINLKIAEQDVLSINEWITKARDNAVEASIEAQANSDKQSRQNLAYRLKNLSKSNLNTHVQQWLGSDRLNSLQKEANATGSDVQLMKALALAYESFEQASAIPDLPEQSTKP